MNSPHWRRLFVLVFVFALVAAACSSDDSDDTTTTAADGETTTTAAAADDETTTTAADTGGDDGGTGDGGDDGSGDGGDDGGTDTGSDGGAFIQEPDGGGTDIECDLWGQDCPDGEKCMPWANDGGSSWNATKAAPSIVSATA